MKVASAQLNGSNGMLKRSAAAPKKQQKKKRKKLMLSKPRPAAAATPVAGMVPDMVLLQEGQFVVEAVLKKRRVKKSGKLEYLGEYTSNPHRNLICQGFL